MATRNHRLAEFDGTGEPSPGVPMELLCEDHVGTYLIPFPCHWKDGAWHGLKSGERIEAVVVGWRTK